MSSHQNNGFKPSPIGQIPVNWNVMELQKCCIKITDGTHDTPIPVEKGVPFLTAIHIKESGIDFDGCYYLPKEVHEQIFRRCNPEKNDVLMVNIGAGVATTALVTVDYQFSLKNVALLKPDKEKLIGSFLNFYQIYYKPQLCKNLLNGGAQPFLSLGQIEKLRIPVPPIKEQISISTFLGTWDKAIEKTTQLITAKEQRKKWLMQQLLTGKKRLMGFKVEWKLTRIADIADEVSIKNKADKELTVLSCTKYDGLVPSLEYFGRRVFGEDTSTYKVVPEKHFAYATNHIEEGSIGYQSRFGEALISPMYTVFKTDDTANDKFLYRVLKSHNYIHEYQKRMEGSIDRRGGLRWDEFSKIKIALPPINEQNAIDEILQTADKEINLLKQKLAAYKEQKKGLMQVLLTGKVRLKTN